MMFELALPIRGLALENKSAGDWYVMDWAAVIAWFCNEAYPFSSNCEEAPQVEGAEGKIEVFSLVPWQAE